MKNPNPTHLMTGLDTQTGNVAPYIDFCQYLSGISSAMLEMGFQNQAWIWQLASEEFKAWLAFAQAAGAGLPPSHPLSARALRWTGMNQEKVAEHA
jgi:hypothetical protein